MINKMSKSLSFALDYLKLANGMATAMGIILGESLIFFWLLFNPLLEERLSHIINPNLTPVELQPLTLFVVFVFNIPSFKKNKGRRMLSPEIEEMFEILRRGKEFGMSDIEIKRKFKSICNRAVEIHIGEGVDDRDKLIIS